MFSFVLSNVLHQLINSDVQLVLFFYFMLSHTKKKGKLSATNWFDGKSGDSLVCFPAIFDVRTGPRRGAVIRIWGHCSRLSTWILSQILSQIRCFFAPRRFFCWTREPLDCEQFSACHCCREIYIAYLRTIGSGSKFRAGSASVGPGNIEGSREKSVGERGDSGDNGDVTDVAISYNSVTGATMKLLKSWPMWWTMRSADINSKGIWWKQTEQDYRYL